MAELPRRLKILNRVYELLKQIRGDGGETYWYTPHQVLKRFAEPIDCTGYPTYMVATDSSPQAPTWAGQKLADETMAVSIKGWVDLEADEAQTKLEKCLADIRKAIMDDQANGGPGSLNELCLACNIENLETDGGILSPDGLAYFDQRFTFLIPIEWGD